MAGSRKRVIKDAAEYENEEYNGNNSGGDQSSLDRML